MLEYNDFIEKFDNLSERLKHMSDPDSETAVLDNLGYMMMDVDNLMNNLIDTNMDGDLVWLIRMRFYFLKTSITNQEYDKFPLELKNIKDCVVRFYFNSGQIAENEEQYEWRS